jgi:hypothetical protein
MIERRRSLGRVALAALAAFLLLLAALAAQMRRAHDGKQVAAVPAPAQRVLVRRIELRRVIVHIVPAPTQEGPTAASITVPANVTVVQSVPAPAAAPPTPAVTPAPVVTRTS